MKVLVGDYIKKVEDQLALPKQVKIFDTTLRDGEQTPGVSLTPEQKLTIARQLDKLGVDVIEAGFPVVSEGERKAVENIAKSGLEAKICALARCKKEDIDTAIKCGVGRVHIFIATSDIHLQHKLHISREQALEEAVKWVEYAKSHGIEVEFSAEDATRTEFEYLKKVYEATVEAGADLINVPDTVGIMTPRATFWLIRELKKTIKVPISIHCHNDFGQAVANSLAAVEAGAEQVHVTVNGIGERAGNAALEEVVMGLRAFYNLKPKVKTELLTETSELVKRLTRVPIQPHKAIVGENAFAHEAGIHVHGVLQFSGTYEPLSPELVGAHRRLLLGKHAGIHSVESQLRELGIQATKEQVMEITRRVKELGDKGKTVSLLDLRAIAESVIRTLPQEQKAVELKEITVTTGNTITPTATVRLLVKGEPRTSSATGVGPVDAALKAIQNVVKEISKLELLEYHLDAITGGSDALADVTIKLKDEKGNVYWAEGVSEDVVLASVQAMINGINQWFLKSTK
jgi:isopropylmalate/citramalate/homocitrate synthase-like protein